MTGPGTWTLDSSCVSCPPGGWAGGWVGGVWRLAAGATVSAYSESPHTTELGMLAVRLEGLRRGMYSAAGLEVRYEWRGA